MKFWSGLGQTAQPTASWTREAASRCATGSSSIHVQAAWDRWGDKKDCQGIEKPLWPIYALLGCSSAICPCLQKCCFKIVKLNIAFPYVSMPFFFFLKCHKFVVFSTSKPMSHLFHTINLRANAVTSFTFFLHWIPNGNLGWRQSVKN